MLGLYVHIPFCNQVCPYCDFTKMVAGRDLKKSYIDALCKEMSIKKLNNYTFDTLYIGGGTPSSLSLDLLDQFFSTLNTYVPLEKLKEISFEMNPEDVNLEILLLLKKYHVSRISLGIQSLNPKIQNVIKRFCTKDRLQEIVNLLHQTGFNNYSFDLMYGFSNETVEDVKNDVLDLISYHPTHISTYALILEEHTILYHKTVTDNLNFEASDDLEAKMYETITSLLEANGYHNYELSNFAIDGYKSLHNLIYWNDESYYTLGAGATSLIDDVRYKTTTSITGYIDGILNQNKVKYTSEALNDEEKLEEYIITNLRKAEGINKEKFIIKFHNDIHNVLPNIELLLKQGILDENNEFIWIKKEYRYVSNAVMAKILY